jgi:CRP-like cAMP-binding protein
VSLEICAAGSGCKQILTLGQGELVGWSSVLDQTYYTTRAHAIETTRLVEINAGQFLTMCERNPKFGFELMRRTALSIAKRLSATRIQLMDVYGGSLPVLPNEIEEGDGE